eukprot:NODE_496_length_6811_cov_0.672378.p6 type:complete len:146 gc:universal NODE_496_length_6811_cov_0.672378:4112-4549(+)
MIYSNLFIQRLSDKNNFFAFDVFNFDIFRLIHTTLVRVFGICSQEKSLNHLLKFQKNLMDPVMKLQKNLDSIALCTAKSVDCIYNGVSYNHHLEEIKLAFEEAFTIIERLPNSTQNIPKIALDLDALYVAAGKGVKNFENKILDN